MQSLFWNANVENLSFLGVVPHEQENKFPYICTKDLHWLFNLKF